MKVGILCAMQEEIALLEQDIRSEQTTVIAGRSYYEGILYGQPVVLAQSRIGKVASASTVTTMLDRFSPDCILFCGTAGGIDPALHVGDIVVADHLVQHDFDSGSDLFRIPLLDVAYFPTDPQLSAELADAVASYVRSAMYDDIPARCREEFGIRIPQIVRGTIASGDQFICSKEKHRWLAEHLDNLKCVEMEGAAVAQVCYEFGVPYTVVRVISDSANDDSNVDFLRFVQEAASHFTRGAVRAFLAARPAEASGN